MYCESAKNSILAATCLAVNFEMYIKIPLVAISSLILDAAIFFPFFRLKEFRSGPEKEGQWIDKAERRGSHYATRAERVENVSFLSLSESWAAAANNGDIYLEYRIALSMPSHLGLVARVCVSEWERKEGKKFFFSSRVLRQIEKGVRSSLCLIL